MSTLTIRPAPSAAEYVRKALRCGHWRDSTEHTKHQAFLEHVGTGVMVGYPTHDGGNDRNAARNFAARAGDECGCMFVTPRGRKRSRRRPETSGFNLDAAIREQHQHTQEVTRLTEVREQLTAALLDRVDADPSLRACQQARSIAKRVVSIEQSLRRLGIDVQPIDVATLTGGRP